MPLADGIVDKFQLLLEKALRAHPFTDAMLREMAINFPQGKQSLDQRSAKTHEMQTHASCLKYQA